MVLRQIRSATRTAHCPAAPPLSLRRSAAHIGGSPTRLTQNRHQCLGLPFLFCAARARDYRDECIPSFVSLSDNEDAIDETR